MLSFSLRQHACLHCQIRHSTQAIGLTSLNTRSPLSPQFRDCLKSAWLAGRSRSTSSISLGTSTSPSTTTNGEYVLGRRAKKEAQRLFSLNDTLKTQLDRMGEEGSSVADQPLEEVLTGRKTNLQIGTEHFRAVERLRQTYLQRSLRELDADLKHIQPMVETDYTFRVGDPATDILAALLLVEPLNPASPANHLVPPAESSNVKQETKSKHETKSKQVLTPPSSHRSQVAQIPSGNSKPPVRTVFAKGNSLKPTVSGKNKIAVLDKQLLRELSVDNIKLEPLPIERSKVPELSHDLSRVLFNPGVYHLQDPRSRVWNFDPYLGSLMPVSEFNYDALNKYITSSEDAVLRDVAIQHSKRYIGSTSSMSGVLSHFHFLLSAWRELTLDNMSRGFKDDGHQFTKIQRGPTAIFLRYKDGVYAVDADKEFDSANILMSLGRSMEKLMTNSMEEFERFRKTHDIEKDTQAQSSEPEAYHYSELGQFLIRSQLDAHDARLPGTGMFDLKTRAVAAARMMVKQHETGAGYQIKERYGTWESYEREYYDMMRSAFLKYSLQVRMGRMDGIFVAYHNTERLFGFQYIPLSEMDLALHGQTDPSLGDREFRMSVKLLSDIFNEATERFPNQSLRFHFEAREATTVQPPHMYIFAEPVSDEEIVEIQSSKRAEVEAFEQRIFNPKRASRTIIDGEAVHGHDSKDTLSEATRDTDAVKSSIASSRQSNAADVEFLETILGVDLGPSEKDGTKLDSEASAPQEPTVEKPLLGWKLHTTNLVNGLATSRPIDLCEADSWLVRYTLTPFTEKERHRNYTLCKNRRKTALNMPDDSDDSVRYYIKRLVSMSKDGAEWRRRLDEYDAQRDKVVLYNDRIVDDNM